MDDSHPSVMQLCAPSLSVADQGDENGMVESGLVNGRAEKIATNPWKGMVVHRSTDWKIAGRTHAEAFYE